MDRRRFLCLGVSALVAGCTEGGDSTTPTPGGDRMASPAPGDLPEAVEGRFVVDGEALSTLTLAVADTSEGREQGLMHRSYLPRDEGMLFVFEAAEERSFWMKNTTVPLDIVFLDGTFRVLNVEHADPDPGDVPDLLLPRYESDGRARYVVEVNQGYADATGLSAGDRLELLSSEA